MKFISDLKWVGWIIIALAVAARLEWEEQRREEIRYEQSVCAGKSTNYKGWEIDCDRPKIIY